jgi:CheY-like chemotaxis protein
MFTMSDRSDFHILVVDDLSDNRFLLQTILETEGYRVDTAEDGRTALAKVRAAPPDLILMDVMMPDLNGYEVTQQIRQNSSIPPIPILMVTAYDDTVHHQGRAVATDGFIRKPIDFEQLLAQVATFFTSQAD